MVVEAALPGQTFIEPGFFFTQQNVGGIAQGVFQLGNVGAVIADTFGPLNTPMPFSTEAAFAAIFGPGGTYGSVGGTGMVRQMWRETPNTLWAVRAGSGGAAAVFSAYTTGGTTTGVTIPVAWPGLGPNGWSVTVRDTPDATQREFLLLAADGSVLLAVTFAKAPATVGGHGEAGALLAALQAYVAAHAGAGDGYLGTPVLLGAPADGSTLANVLDAAPTTSGTAVTTVAGDYATALATLNAIALNAVATDSSSQVVAASLQAWVDSQRSFGKFVIGVTAEPTSVSRATRLADAASYNDPAFGYLGNGYVDAYGNHEGADVAGRFAAAYAANGILTGFTQYVIKGATKVIDVFDTPSFRSAIQAGMMIFDRNESNQVVFGYGNTTFLTPNTNLDAGWKKWRRVKVRDAFVGTVAATLAPIVGQFSNTPRTRTNIVLAAQRVINQFLALGAFAVPTAAQLALMPEDIRGSINTCFEDPNNPAQGDTAHFIVIAFDADTLDHIYFTFGWQF